MDDGSATGARASDLNSLLPLCEVGEVAEGAMSLVVRHTGDAVIVLVAGDVDLVTAGRLHDTVSVELAAAPGIVVIDLDQVTFFTSVGLTMLALAHRAARERGIDLRVVATNRAVLRPLEITGMRDDLAIYPRRSDALAGCPALNETPAPPPGE